jgi:nanoRNase/pAp phosphatase (c-di-AMP/oligoRNAs hydrolase)
MSQSTAAQFEKMIGKSEHALILLPERPNNDVYCSGVALGHFCDERKISTTLAFIDPYEDVEQLQFLPKSMRTTIKHSIAGSRDLILSFNTTYNKIHNVRTEQTDERLNIYITPEKGMVDSRDFSFLPSKFPYDVIITIGASDKESMGKIYDEIPDIFYEVPIINIDNKSTNEHFGQLNIINTVASSVSEIVADILKQCQNHVISRECAQCLLAGIISETNSFQNHNTTPHALTLASHLIECGAEQQVIIKNLYRNQTFSLLQLWGHVMKNLSSAPCHEKIVISTITHNHLGHIHAKKHHLHAILEKMQQNYPLGKIFVLLFEHDDNTFTALINTSNATLPLEDRVDNITMVTEFTYELPLSAHNHDSAKDMICKMLTPYIDHL